MKVRKYPFGGLDYLVNGGGKEIMTYVAAAMGMLAQLLYYVSLLSGRQND